MRGRDQMNQGRWRDDDERRHDEDDEWRRGERSRQAGYERDWSRAGSSERDTSGYGRGEWSPAREQGRYPGERGERFGRREDRGYGGQSYGEDERGERARSSYADETVRPGYGSYSQPDYGGSYRYPILGGFERERERFREPSRQQRDEDRGDDRGLLERAGEWIQRKLGKAPKGYTRSDERIRDDVAEAFWRRHDIDASDVEIVVKEAEVTLTGTVNDRRTKRLVEDLAEDVLGVSDVHNQVKVRREGQSPSLPQNGNRPSGSATTSSPMTSPTTPKTPRA